MHFVIQLLNFHAHIRFTFYLLHVPYAYQKQCAKFALKQGDLPRNTDFLIAKSLPGKHVWIQKTSGRQAHLWIAKVQSLIKQFVYKNKVILDALLTKFSSKIGFEQIDNLHQGIFKLVQVVSEIINKPIDSKKQGRLDCF